MKPPPLRNDCFALPPGVHWTPVEEALERLRNAVRPVTATERVAVDAADRRFLAGGVTAARANPPVANAAVDGYGFAAETIGPTPHILPLVAGRAAAGAGLDTAVPPGRAVRILTGAPLPAGVDTVVLDEDVAADADRVAFHGPLKRGANTRRAGEDVSAGENVLAPGHRLRPQDLALCAALGVGALSVHAPLRVGVLSTGDELRPPGMPIPHDAIYDANRPMLLALAARWGFDAADLGHVPDDRGKLAERLDAAAAAVDVVLTTGGASAGDEDHVSALLGERGNLALWRVAVKPGRPLALALWRGVPVFGLPGNPVAAFVCALVFAAPALRRLAGGDWRLPRPFAVPAAFEKNKRAGRREFLRARLNAAGAAEVFASEGSGRISGLTWSDGLVELGDSAHAVRPGDPVSYYPYTAFEL